MLTLTRTAGKSWLALLLLSSLQWGGMAPGVRAATVEIGPSRPHPVSAPSPICPAQLERAIAAIVAQPDFRRSRWGVVIETLGPGATRLYARDPQHLFIPASNVKLLTTAAALTQLGPQYRLRTLVYGVGTAPQLQQLRIVGQGDPSLTPAQLQDLAQDLRSRGIRQIEQLIGDDSYFQGSAVPPTWAWEDLQAGYGAPVNSLILNQNLLEFNLWPQALGQPLRVAGLEAGPWQIHNTSVTVAATAPEFVAVGRELHQPLIRISGQLRVGAAPEPVAVPVLHPAQHFLQQFRQILQAAQISVGQTQVTTTGQGLPGQAWAEITSPPLAALLGDTNRDSNNLYAEALLKTLGATQAHSSTASTTESGVQVLQATLTQLGIDAQSYLLVDGSGLSRQNLASPEALVQTLQAMATRPHFGVYRASLAIAGKNGTLASRLLNTPAQGALWAKTGSLRGVAALSGYLNPPNFPPLVFSILVNQAQLPPATVRQAIDEIVLLLTRLQPCDSQNRPHSQPRANRQTFFPPALPPSSRLNRGGHRQGTGSAIASGVRGSSGRSSGDLELLK